MTMREAQLRGLEPARGTWSPCHPEGPSGHEGSPLLLPRGASVLLALALLAVSPPRRLAAQSDLGLPVSMPANILAADRSPLYFQPWVPHHEGTRLTVAFDYANIFEYNRGFIGGTYIQDLELSTVRLRATRDLSPATFVMADASINTAWKGGLDGFLHWWHGLLGIEIPERELRPEHRFGYDLGLPNGDSVSYRPATYLGDLRLGAGWRFRPHGQLVGTVTLPTATAEGYGKRVASAALLLTGWSELDPRLRVEGSVGLGYTPRTDGTLRPYQRTTFMTAGGGFRWRFYRQASMFGTIYWHSPYYAHTTMRALDGNDVTFDFGWIFRTPGGAEWRVGMAEDPNPSGPGVDATFKASRSW